MFGFLGVVAAGLALGGIVTGDVALLAAAYLIFALVLVPAAIRDKKEE